jgi:hypothetical protein
VSYVSARLSRLERALLAGQGQCPVCRPVRSAGADARVVLTWADAEPSAPRLCPRCGEPWPVIQLTWDLSADGLDGGRDA